MHYSLHDVPVSLFLGVPEEERAHKQEIRASVSFEAEATLQQTKDQFEGLVDYDALYKAIQAFPGERVFITLEYLYYGLLEHLQQSFPQAESLQLTIEKFPFSSGSITIQK